MKNRSFGRDWVNISIVGDNAIMPSKIIASRLEKLGTAPVKDGPVQC
jgi:hypothetical protein